MEETLSLHVNMPFDKRAVCTKSGHEPFHEQNLYNYMGDFRFRSLLFQLETIQIRVLVRQ
jgi:hypothetical protein